MVSRKSFSQIAFWILWQINIYLMLFISMVQGATYYVDDDYGNPYPGSGIPTDPSHEIQWGIDAATYGDIVQVAEGTYHEIITMKSGVEILGSGSSNCIIDGNENGPVVTASSVDSAAKLDGFRIQFGYATLGGGMKVVSCSPTISNCVFSSNDADTSGGGMYNYRDHPTLLTAVLPATQLMIVAVVCTTLRVVRSLPIVPSATTRWSICMVQVVQVVECITNPVIQN